MESIESFTVKLEAASEGVGLTTDLGVIRPVFRQHAEVVLKFGVRTNLADLNPVMAAAFPGTLTVVPVSDNALNLIMTFADGSGSSSLRLEVSTDGNTLTESYLPDDFRLVFNRQF